MKVQVGIIFFLCGLISFSVSAQSTGLMHKGYCELEIGKDFWSVKHLLSPKPEPSSSGQLVYKVRASEKKYHEIAGVTVNSIEVRFEDKKIVDILMLLDKTNKNIATLKETIKNEFGAYSCINTSKEAGLFNCSVNAPADACKFHFYTFDETGEFEVNGFLCIRFFMNKAIAEVK